MEELGLWISTDALHVQERTLLGFNGLLIAKVLLLGVSAIMNYLFSKFVIFRK